MNQDKKGVYMSNKLISLKGRHERFKSSDSGNVDYEENTVTFNSFFGGEENGQMIQITIIGNDGINYSQLTKDQICHVIKVLIENYDLQETTQGTAVLKTAYHKLLVDVLNAWEKLPSGPNAFGEVEGWLNDDMHPAIKNIRRCLGKSK